MFKKYIKKIVMQVLNAELSHIYSSINELEYQNGVLRSRLYTMMSSDHVVVEQKINPDAWVTAEYFNNVNHTDVSDNKLKDVWAKLHHSQTPKRCYINPDVYIYPADFIASVINGRYDHFK